MVGFQSIQTMASILKRLQKLQGGSQIPQQCGLCKSVEHFSLKGFRKFCTLQCDAQITVKTDQTKQLSPHEKDFLTLLVVNLSLQLKARLQGQFLPRKFCRACSRPRICWLAPCKTCVFSTTLNTVLLAVVGSSWCVCICASRRIWSTARCSRQAWSGHRFIQSSVCTSVPCCKLWSWCWVRAKGKIPRRSVGRWYRNTIHSKRCHR